jgi:hypothetical protein
MYIPCMLEPLPKGYEPPIQSAREGRHFCALGLSRAGNCWCCITTCINAFSCIYCAFKGHYSKVTSPQSQVHSRQAPFSTWSLEARQLLVLQNDLWKHTIIDILRIQEPLPNRYEPPILRALEGRHFSALGSSKGTARTLVETHSDRYTMHSRAIHRRLPPPDPGCTQGQALFSTWFLEGRQLSALHKHL